MSEAGARRAASKAVSYRQLAAADLIAKAEALLRERACCCLGDGAPA
jgi:hypothetical protein